MLYDVDRARLRGTLEHLATLGQLLAGRDVDPELAGHLQDLRTAGAVVGTDVAPDLRELIAVVGRPQVVVELETSSPAGVVRHSVSVRDRQGWVAEGWGGSDEVTWWPVEPALLVPTVASLVGLRRRPADLERTEVRAPLGLVERALQALQLAGHENRPTALAAVRSAAQEELAPPAVDGLVELLAAHRAAWRVSVLRHDGEEPSVRALAVVDAGPLGLFERTAPAEPVETGDLTAGTEVVLTPTTPGRVWTAVTALLGDGRDAEAAA